MKRIVFSFTTFLLTAFLLFSLTLYFPKKLLAKAPTLTRTEYQLSMNQTSLLKIKDLPKGSKLQFSSKNHEVCSISSKGIMKAHLPGNSEIEVKILTKKGRFITKLTASVLVSTTFLARTQGDLNRAHLSKRAEFVLLKPKKESHFSLPKGRLGYSLSIDMGDSKKKLELEIKKETSIREIILLNAEKAKFQVKASLPSLILRGSKADVSVILADKKGEITSLFAEALGKLSLSFRSKAKNKIGTKVYLSAKNMVKLTGEPLSPLSVFVWKDAAESEVISSVPLHYVVDVPSVLTIQKNTKNVIISTLNYKVPVTVRNESDDEIVVNTPSFVKNVPAKTRKTITGK